MRMAPPSLAAYHFAVQFVQTFKDPSAATCTTLRPGASARPASEHVQERAKTGNSRERNEGPAQLRTDTKSRRLRGLGVLPATAS